MKKIFTLVFIALFSFQMQGQDKIPNIEPGKGYALCLDTVDYAIEDEEYVLKIVSPEWEKYTDTVFRTADTMLVITGKSTDLWHISNTNDPNIAPNYCILLYHIEAPQRSKMVYFEENDSFKIMEMWKLTRPASVEWVTTTTAESSSDFTGYTPYEVAKDVGFKHKAYPVLYIKSESGHRMKWYETLSVFHVEMPHAVSNIQKALKEQDYYSGEINNIMDEATKAALMKFQKDNNLPVGNLDFDTLRALGLQY